jgi:ParB family chromosome partitioning protein
MNMHRKLTPVTELLGLSSDASNQSDNNDNAICELRIDRLLPFKEHPFKPYTGTKMDDLVKSIKEMGVITPIIVRPADRNMYEILSGHNRVNASRIAGKGKVRAVVKENITDDEAVIIVTETNFFQRSINDMLPSELAKSFQMQLEACKKMGKKSELVSEIIHPSNSHGDSICSDSAQVGQRQWSINKVADENKMGKTNIQRYIRLNFLVPELLDRVDDGYIAFIPAVDLSYLKPEEQQIVDDILTEGGWKIDMVKAKALRVFSEKAGLTVETVREIVTGAKKAGTPGRPTGFKLKPKLISRFFPGEQKKDVIEDVIEKALTMYFNNLKENVET